MLRKLPNWDEGIDYEEHEEDKVTIQSLYGTKECFEYQSMQKAADRMANNAALVNVHRLVIFIEVAFPNTPVSEDASVHEVLYNEMDHESFLTELLVLTAQILGPALIILPITFFSIAWMTFETWYYGDLPLAANPDRYTYNSVDLVLVAVLQGFTGYIRFSLPGFIVLSLICCYLTVELYNALDITIVHGTKYEKKGYWSRALEMRQIAFEQGQRMKYFNGSNGLHYWRGIDEGDIEEPFPLDRKSVA